jgi:homocysteine S-methyltransferase
VIIEDGLAIVDGGLGMELVRRGFVFETALWSGEAILAAPDLLAAIHRDYLSAGARVIETATYQLSHTTLRELGYDDVAIDGVFARAVQLARDAIAAHRALAGDVKLPLDRVASAGYIVAGSMGPYGATLGDGSEYSGAQHLAREALYEFHAERARCMARAAPDVFLFETIPSRTEGLIVAEVARDLGLRKVWISFSCADGERTCAGDRIALIAAELDVFACVDVVGVNCTAPDDIAPLVRSIRSGTAKAVLVCPNLGQHWENDAHALAGGTTETEFERRVLEWLDLGVTYIGGCCGVGPSTIASIARIRELQSGLGSGASPN